MRQLSRGDLSINYRCAGEGRDVVLIHGLAANHAFWHFSVLLPLAEHYRLTVYDLRGHGRSSMPPSGYTTADMAGDLHLLLDHLQIQKADLVGHSFGGVVALHYATIHPDRVRSLTVADSRIRALQPVNHPRDWQNRERAMKRLAELGLFVPDNEPDVGLWLLEQVARPEMQKVRDQLKGNPILFPFGARNGGSKSAERWLELLDTTTARKDFRDEAGLTVEKIVRIGQPILALYGDASPTLPSGQGLKEKLKSCTMEVVPNAGHFFMLTKPKLFVDIVGRFLNEQKEA